MPNRHSYLLVEDDESLAEFCHGVPAGAPLAIDTEFVGEKYFYPRLEVVQLGDGDRIALIDAQRIRNWAPLARLVREPDRLKIFHAGSQDLPLLKRTLAVPPTPCFDTQVAASLLGFGAQISLTNLVRALLGVDLASKHSTSDWSARPFTRGQLDYAANDVLYLHKLHVLLRERLVFRGRLPWYEEEQHAAVADTLSEEEAPEDQAWRRVKEWNSLSRQELAVLRELAIFRERQAKHENSTRRATLTDESLVEMARFQPASREEAKKLRRIHVGQVLRYFDQLRAAIDRGLKCPKEQWPEKNAGERQDIPTGLLELCQALVRTVAEKEDIAPTVMCTTAELSRLVHHRGELKPEEHPLLHGWRRDLIGRKLVDLLHGRVFVTVGKDGCLEFVDKAATA